MEDFSFSFRIFPRIIPDKLHGFKNKWANVSTTLSDRKNCYPTKYVVSPLYIYLARFIQCCIVDNGLFTWSNEIDGTILSFRPRSYRSN